MESYRKEKNQNDFIVYDGENEWNYSKRIEAHQASHTFARPREEIDITGELKRASSHRQTKECVNWIYRDGSICEAHDNRILWNEIIGSLIEFPPEHYSSLLWL